MIERIMEIDKILMECENEFPIGDSIGNSISEARLLMSKLAEEIDKDYLIMHMYSIIKEVYSEREAVDDYPYMKKMQKIIEKVEESEG